MTQHRQSQQFLEILKQGGWLKSAFWLPRVDSTNTWAREFVGQLARSQFDQSLPAVFLADAQSQGRGRGDHTWFSPVGCLMTTIVVSAADLHFDRGRWNELSLLVGVAAAEAIDNACPPLAVQLKWPNDLYLNQRKVGGILIESCWLPDQPPAFLIGIGINVAVDWSSAPSDVRARATCLSTQLESSIDSAEVMTALVESLADRIAGWQSDTFNWHHAWQNRCMLTGQTVSVTRVRAMGHSEKTAKDEASFGKPDLREQERLGRCEGISPSGHLLVRGETGEVVSIAVGEVRIHAP